jgi:hypothetical protein
MTLSDSEFERMRESLKIAAVQSAIPMWSVPEALGFIRQIHPIAFKAGWNLHLGGGLATRSDISYNDADILAMPRYQKDAPHLILPVVQHLLSLEWTDMRAYVLPRRKVHSFRKGRQVLEMIFVDP